MLIDDARAWSMTTVAAVMRHARDHHPCRLNAVTYYPYRPILYFAGSSCIRCYGCALYLNGRANCITRGRGEIKKNKK